jgi:hypothetical protein
MDCPDVMIQGQPVADPDSVTVTLRPCGCTASKADPDFGQFVDIVKWFYLKRRIWRCACELLWL